jgi:hypothetical protein
MGTSATAKSPSMTAESPSGGVNTSMFWERFWRSAGIQFVLFFIITSVIYGYQPGVHASLDALAAFYNGDRTRPYRGGVF